MWKRLKGPAETQIGVLFVCMGNICRSPTAESVFRKHVLLAGFSDQLFIDSAGIGDWHAGEPPDSRAVTHARRRGYDLSALRARQVVLHGRVGQARPRNWPSLGGSRQPPNRGQPLIPPLDRDVVGCYRAPNTCRARHSLRAELARTDLIGS